MDHLRVHSIPGGACNIRNDHPVFAQHLIDDGGLAHIGLAYDGYSGTVVLFVVVLVWSKMLCHLVQKLSQAQPGGCGYGDGIPDAQVIEFIYVVGKPNVGKDVYKRQGSICPP